MATKNKPGGIVLFRSPRFQPSTMMNPSGRRVRKAICPIRLCPSMDKPSATALAPHPPPADADVLTRAAAVADRCAALAAWRDDPAHSPSVGVRAGDFPSTEFGWLADAGLLAAPLPSSAGGVGLNASGQWLTLLRALKHVGRGCLAAGRIYEGHVNALALVERFGTPAQLARAASDVCEHRHVFGVWNADDDQPGAPPLRLVDLGGGRYRMEGRKIFCSGAGHLWRPIVGARWQGEGGGWQLCLVPMEQVAARIDDAWWQPMGMEASASAAIDFTGIELGPDTLLGAPNDYYREPWFNGGAIRFAAVHLGGAEALYDDARQYLRASGKADQAAQRIRFAELAVRMETGALWLRGAAASAERPPAEAAEIVAYAAMTRTAIEAVCMDVIRGVERAVGARGLMRPWPFPRMIRDLSMYIRQPAADIIIDRIGRNALEDPRPAHALWPWPAEI